MPRVVKLRRPSSCFTGSSNLPQLEALLQEAGGTLVQRPLPRAAVTAAAAAAPGCCGGGAVAHTSLAASLFGGAAGDDPYTVSSRGGSPEDSGSGGGNGCCFAGAAGNAPGAISIPPVVVLVVRERGGKDKDLSGLVARVAREWGCPLVLTTWVYDSVSLCRRRASCSRCRGTYAAFWTAPCCVARLLACLAWSWDL